MISFLGLLTLLALLQHSSALEGLSPDQVDWIDSLRFGNVSSMWPALTETQIRMLRDNVMQFETLVWPANFPFQQAVEVVYSDREKSKIVYYDDCGDSAAWTGLYLASLSHRYNSTRNATILDRIQLIVKKIYTMTQCTGKIGFLPRIMGLASDPAFAAYYKGYKPHYLCVAPYEEYVWLGSTSRDMYFGIAFGLTSAWVYVQDEATKLLVQQVIETILDDLIKYHFWIISPKETLTNPTPLFSAVFRKLALTVNSTKYSNEQLGYDIDFALTVATRGFSLQDKWASGYFVDELTVEGLYILSILEISNDTKRSILFTEFTEAAVGHSDHFQPGFAAFYLSAFPSSPHFDIPKGVLQGGLFDYPSSPDWGHQVDQTNNSKYFPHKKEGYSEYALWIRDRPPDTYQWQRAPTKLKGGDVSTMQYPHIDILLPFWMGKTSGFI